MMALVCALVSILPNAAGAHGVTLKVHHSFPENSPFHVQFLLPWKDRLEQESHGLLRIQLYPSMLLGGNPAQLYDQVKDRTADIVWTAVDDSGRFPAFAVFNLPLNASSARGSSRALWEYVQMHDLAKREFPGVRLLAVHAGVIKADPGAHPLQESALTTSSWSPGTFILVMNAATYKSLSDELRQVINANSGAETSAWLGKVFDQSAAQAEKSVTVSDGAPVAERIPLQQQAQSAIEKRIQELDERGLNGKELIESARALLTEYDAPK
jgi:TRAP-type C4-dicarboxylate transport system substrate-binding protein